MNLQVGRLMSLVFPWPSGFSGGCHGRQAMLVSRAQKRKEFPRSCHHATIMLEAYKEPR